MKALPQEPQLEVLEQRPGLLVSLLLELFLRVPTIILQCKRGGMVIPPVP